MSKAKDVWGHLSALNVNEHTERKGKFTYLSWAWAWRSVKDSYPSANFELLDDIVYPDGTMEVRVSVTIEAISHTAFLPVLDFKNKPISAPNSFDVNTARMRCLVKALAFHGLGLYIYSGEDLPAPSSELADKYEEMLGLVAHGKVWELRKFMDENKEISEQLFNMAPEGKKTKFKTDVRTAYSKSNSELKTSLAALEECAGDPDSSYSATEIMAEMGEIERLITTAAMNETLRKQIEDKLKEGE